MVLKSSLSNATARYRARVTFQDAIHLRSNRADDAEVFRMLFVLTHSIKTHQDIMLH